MAEFVGQADLLAVSRMILKVGTATVHHDVLAASSFNGLMYLRCQAVVTRQDQEPNVGLGC